MYLSAFSLPVLDWKAQGCEAYTGGQGGTLTVEGPCCSNLSCTSARGMQHLPTHNRFSSCSSRPFPHQFIQNPTHSPDVSLA